MASVQSQLQRAITQISDKPPIPEIDFTQHQLEDGSHVSTQERVIKDVSGYISHSTLHSNIMTYSFFQVQAPAMFVPSEEQFFSREDPSKPDVAFLKNHFYREGRVTEEQALYILEKGTELLRAEPNLLEVDAPITGMSLLMPTLAPSRAQALKLHFLLTIQCAETFTANM